MEKIKDFINTFFLLTVKNEKDGLRCSFITEQGEEGYVILKRGKTGWNTKPVMNSPYVITESDMMGALQIISSKFDINEDHYEKIKDEINKRIELSLKDFLSPDL